MLLILIDVLVFAAILVFVFFTARNILRKNKDQKLELALARQKRSEELAKKVDDLNIEALKENEKKINNKLDGLH